MRQIRLAFIVQIFLALNIGSGEHLFAYSVKASREGEVGKGTATGHTIIANDWFVALPHPSSLDNNGDWTPRVRVTCAQTTTGKTRSIVAPIWDVGPWNTQDNYWDEESARDIYARLRSWWWNNGAINHRQPATPNLPPSWTDAGFPVDATHPALPHIGVGTPEAGKAYDTSASYTVDSYNYGCDQSGRHRWYTAWLLNGAGIDLADGIVVNGLKPANAIVTFPVDWDFTNDLPSVQKITITQDSTIIYDSETGTSNSAKEGSLTFKIIFTETMKTESLPVVTFGVNAPYADNIVSNGSWSQTTYENDTWTGTANIASGTNDGKNTVSIYALDAGGMNQIDKDRNSANGFQPGKDTSVAFTIGSRPFVANDTREAIPDGGFAKTDSVYVNGPAGTANLRLIWGEYQETEPGSSVLFDWLDDMPYIVEALDASGTVLKSSSFTNDRAVPEVQYLAAGGQNDITVTTETTITVHVKDNGPSGIDRIVLSGAKTSTITVAGLPAADSDFTGLVPGRYTVRTYDRAGNPSPTPDKAFTVITRPESI